MLKKTERKEARGKKKEENGRGNRRK
jgi:hypothetical protein